jgi:hypothetical protein
MIRIYQTEKDAEFARVRSSVTIKADAEAYWHFGHKIMWGGYRRFLKETHGIEYAASGEAVMSVLDQPELFEEYLKGADKFEEWNGQYFMWKPENKPFTGEIELYELEPSDTVMLLNEYLALSRNGPLKAFLRALRGK